VHNQTCEPWRVTLADTGVDTMTGGRLRRVRDYVGNETFFFTYGDGLCDVDLRQLLEFHRSKGTVATLTAVQPPGRFGTFTLQDEQSLQIKAQTGKPIGRDWQTWSAAMFLYAAHSVETQSTPWFDEARKRGDGSRA
jgi:glucose-1-phosphate cytidylyltransferase